MQSYIVLFRKMSIGSLRPTIVKRTTPLNNWTFENSTYVASPQYQRTGFTTFSEFVPISATSVLPLTLLSFRGQAHGNQNLLSWQTTRERNTESFEVQRSIDGITFFPIGEIKAKNNGLNQINEYQFTDQEPLNMQSYYRIRQIDADGAFTYSKIIMLQNEKATKLEWLVYPNPTKDGSVNLWFNQKSNTLKIQIVDLAGREIHQQQILNPKATTTLNLPHLKGIYLLRVQTDTETWVQKLKIE